MDSMSFHMEIPYGVESPKWLGYQPKHIPYGIGGMTWIPHGFHVECGGTVKTSKHAMQGHDLNGIDSTAPGELTVECPACPHPCYEPQLVKSLSDNRILS